MDGRNFFDELRYLGEMDLAAELLRSREVRLFCGLLLEESGFLKPSYCDSERDTAFREGERNFGQRVFELLWRVDDSAPLGCMAEYGAYLEALKDEADRKAAGLKEDDVYGGNDGNDGGN